MQRKSNLLKPYTKNRSGIAMLIAIAFLVLAATLMALMINLTANTTKRTADTFFQEQAHLLAKSATEFALLAISGHERVGANNCITTINTDYPGAGAAAIFNINTSIRYIGLEDLGGTCRSQSAIDTGSAISTISTPESVGTIIIDTYVTTTALANMSEPVRFHRRTMQKP